MPLIAFFFLSLLVAVVQSVKTGDTIAWWAVGGCAILLVIRGIWNAGRIKAITSAPEEHHSGP